MKYAHITNGALALKTWLETSGTSQTQLAALLNLHFTTLTGWLRGRNVPRIGLWADIEQLTQGAVPPIAWTQPAPTAAAASPCTAKKGGSQ